MFDLEEAIREWKKNLARESAMDETYILELEAVLRDEVADLVRKGLSEEDAFLRAREAMGETPAIGREFGKVRRPKRRREKLRRLLMPDLLWNYIRVSVRRIRLQKGYSFINVAGLAVGLACCLLMMLWIRDERSYDRFHANRDLIYRLISETKTENAVLLDARSPTALGPALKAEVPEVVDFCRYTTNTWYGFFVNNKLEIGDVFGVADPSFFSIFTFPFLRGDPKTALVEPKSIVITEGLTRKYFGGSDPMGKTLLVGLLRDPFRVTGVIKDVPKNSHLRFDCVIPTAPMTEYHHVDFASWDSMFFTAYVRLAPKAEAAAAGRKIAALLAAKSPKTAASVRLQPLADVHLKSDFAFDGTNASPGSASTLAAFSIAAFAILLLACINFMNLATARSANRAKEVGLRKVTGACRSDLVKQFLGESCVLSIAGVVLAVGLVGLALPLFNSLAGKHLILGRLFRAEEFALVIGITLLTGLIAGSYPAVFLSAFRPAKVLRDKGLSAGRGHAGLRKILVVIQFALTVFLVMGTLVVDKQLRYVRNKNLGVDTHSVVTMDAPRPGMKEAYLAYPGVESVSQAIAPGLQPRDNTTVTWEGKNPGTIVPFLPISVDEDYLRVFRIGMTDGRFFSKERPADNRDSVVINETAARVLGPGSPLGKRLTYSAMNGRGAMETRTLTVIGIMKDFHQTSLRQAIEPMLFINNGQSIVAQVRLRPSDVGGSLEFLERTWKTFVPDYPFSYHFVDERIDGFYASERRVRSIIGIFAVLALFTACLGLAGLSSFLVERRTKEIGIRKVMGASARSLVVMQTREFAAWVLLANVIAWPAAYIGIDRWLRGFAYRVSPGIAPAAITAGLSLAVALLAVGYQAVRASSANPVESLKYE